MNAIKNLKFSHFALAVCASSFLIVPHSVRAESFSAEQKTELNTLFETYIMEHPEVIMKSVEQYRTNQEQKTAQDAQANLAKHQESFNDKSLPSTGNPDGDITIVEYFDYNCGYCKRFYTDMMTLIEEDKNVRIVLKDLPILSPASDMMARFSLAAHKQGKYFEMHQALMGHRGEQTEEAFLELAKKAGIDVEKLKVDKNDPSIEEALKKDMESARDLGIQGTPGLVIGDQIYRGYIGLDGVKQSIKEAREKKAAAPAAAAKP